MHLSLIGMSGSGKSHWSKKLQKEGFERFCCDDLISVKLEPQLRLPDGRFQDLGVWMGRPYEPGYPEREREYLSFEIEVLEEILSYLQSGTAADNVVVDTTGSVIYAGEGILRRLRDLTTVVHFRTPPEIQEIMLQNYLSKHRPVLWQGMFQQKPSETEEEALARCYALLLSTREKVYSRNAHVSIDYGDRRAVGFTVEDFLKTVRKDQ
jgi:shikimate kinase